MSANANENKFKKSWYNRWWGILILIVFVVLLLYVGNFIYQVVFLLEEQQTFFYENLRDLRDIAIASQGAGDERQKQLAETDDDPFWGPIQSDIVIVEFSDFQCPFCKQAQVTVSRLKQNYSDLVKFVYRDFPVAISHPQAMNAALAAQCAFEQGRFWQYHDLIFVNQSRLSKEFFKTMAGQLDLNQSQFDDCLDDQKYLTEIQDDMQDGISLGIRGTPTFFINGLKVPGVISYDDFTSIIDKIQEENKSEE